MNERSTVSVNKELVHTTSKLCRELVKPKINVHEHVEDAIKKANKELMETKGITPDMLD